MWATNPIIVAAISSHGAWRFVGLVNLSPCSGTIAVECQIEGL
jgi:hypothetical protein